MIFRFSSFRIDVAERVLLRDGHPVALRSKVFDTLALLVQSHGRLLRKPELMRSLWPDSNVEENNLDHNISTLRKVLGDGKDGARYIETVPRQGYRFIASVQAVADGIAREKALELGDDDAEQRIEFFTTSDGVRIAYAIGGSGPVLVRTVDWLNHLDLEWRNPLQRRWFKQVMQHHTLLRYDQRGSGLSDWNIEDFSFQRSVQDLAELLEHLGLQRISFFSSCQGGPIATAYTVRNPERVAALVLVGAFARGWPVPDTIFAEQFEALLALIRTGWGQDNPAFRQMWTTLFMPDATAEQMNWMNEMQRVTSIPENAARMMAEFPSINIFDLLPKVSCPTLVMHSRDDAVVPVQEGRLIASRIPGAHFVELPSRSHQVGPEEPAFQDFVRETARFLGWDSLAADAGGK